VGLRGIAAWALAPIVTVAEIAVLAVIAARLGAPWSVPFVAIVCAVTAAATAAVAFVLRGRAPARDPDARSVTAAAAIGLVPALLLGAVTVARGLGRPDALSQTFDAVFHYNAVALILDSRNASSLTIGSLGTPGLPGTFYPAAWHDLTSLVVLTSGSSIPLAANMVCAVVGILIWPLSCLLLVRQIVGPSPAAMAITGVLSIGFSAFPWGLMSWGVLWPNLLGMSIAPAGLAVVISLCGLAKDDALGRGRAWLLLPVTVLAATLGHPNVLFSLVALSVFPVANAMVRRALPWDAPRRALPRSWSPSRSSPPGGGGPRRHRFWRLSGRSTGRRSSWPSTRLARCCSTPQTNSRRCGCSRCWSCSGACCVPGSRTCAGWSPGKLSRAGCMC
jgi:hypothetical protein